MKARGAVPLVRASLSSCCAHDPRNAAMLSQWIASLIHRNHLALLSRPPIYLKFKNQQDLFAGVFDYLTEGRMERAMAAVNGNGSRRDPQQKT